MDYRDGTDLLLSVGGKTLGHSDNCEIQYQAETGTRKTKEKSAGKYNESYVKSLAVSITASGFVHAADKDNNLPTLITLWKACAPIDASWDTRESSDPHSGKFILTDVKDTGKAGDDETYSITLKNSGAIDETTTTP